MTSSKPTIKKPSDKPANHKRFKETADAMKQVQAVMDKAALEAGKKECERLQETNPELAFHILPGNRCLPRAEIPFTEVYLKIVDALLSQGGVDKTQKAIIEEIGDKHFPSKGKISPNVWTRPLEPWAVKKIMMRVKGNMAKPVDVTGCETLAEIKRTLKVHHSDGDAVFQYSGKIIVNKKAVAAGTENYTIMKRRDAYAIQVATHSGKMQWIRLDALLALLGNLKMTRID